jgi:micrococcal nuclease
MRTIPVSTLSYSPTAPKSVPVQVRVKRYVNLPFHMVLAVLATISCRGQPTPLPAPLAPTDTPASSVTMSATLLSATSTSLPTSTHVPTGAESAHVSRVIDGDTIEVTINGGSYRLRYIGMNTPETDQVCGSTATDANAALIADQDVFLVKDVSETDRYGRLLRYVYVGDLFVNAELVRQGFAEAATYPPDVAHADEFVQLAAQARDAQLGCWATGVWGSVEPEEGRTSAATDSPQSGVLCECTGRDLDCGSFSTHTEAQACFDHCMTEGFGDTFGLDGDGDNIACESLP